MARDQGKNLHLRVSLSDTDLLSVLRDRAARTLGKSKAPLKPGAKSDVIAQFTTALDTVTLTGMLNQRHPIRFNLKPETRTYGNFIRFFLRELRSLEAPAHPTSQTGDELEAVDRLTKYLEHKLQQIELDAQSNAEDITDIIDVFSDDLEVSEASPVAATDGMVSLPAAGPAHSKRKRSAKFVIGKARSEHQKQFRLVDSGDEDVTPRHISGFLSLEIEEVSDPEPPSAAQAAAWDLERLRSSLTIIRREFVLHGDSAEVIFEATLDRDISERVEFGVHWGSYARTSTGWFDEEIANEEIRQPEPGRYVITKRLTPGFEGYFGATLYAKTLALADRVWMSELGHPDLSFPLDAVESLPVVQDRREDLVERFEFQASLVRALSDFDRFVRVVNQLVRLKEVRGLGRYLFEATKSDPGLRRIVSDYYHRAIIELGEKRSSVVQGRLKTVISVLQNIGIGEVVFIAPEGPQAIAGGLAQVIVGLTSSLSRIGISTTVITPLYEEAQGNKHRSATEVIQSGVEINGHVVPVVEVGAVKIPFGPVYLAGTDTIQTHARIVVANVYRAEHDGVRVYFLRHRRLADRLYGHVSDEDQLRRSVFLCRGALELCRDSKFDVNPHALITNDWATALVPVYLRTEPRYRDHHQLRHVEPVHILHNAGRDYQGRFNSVCFGADLYPLLGVSGEHYFGLSDPLNINQLNLTAGAVLHAGKALLAVSRPYAQQLMTDEGGEGLGALFRERASVLFGISNGIDLTALRQLFWKLGETAREELGLEPLMKKRFSSAKLLKRIKDYKSAMRSCVQRKHGLKEDPNAILISLVGRIAEQKGIQLLAGSAFSGAPSVLEFFLRKYPNVQFLIGGPPNNGDPAVEHFRPIVEDLVARFPGRIQAVFSFIPHREALEITQGSDAFLMPSRFEPGGITQLEALACGTPVIARRVGGLAATLVDYSEGQERGNSFLFTEFSSAALQDAMSRALTVFKDGRRREWLMSQAVLAENDWSHRAPKYVTVLQHVAGVLLPDNSYPHLHGRGHLLGSIRPS
ncbi:MAG: glycogen/starch synthase [Bdellovibrionota bacterium]